IKVAGGNELIPTVIVSHRPNLQDAAGKEFRVAGDVEPMTRCLRAPAHSSTAIPNISPPSQHPADEKLACVPWGSWLADPALRPVENGFGDAHCAPVLSFRDWADQSRIACHDCVR